MRCHHHIGQFTIPLLTSLLVGVSDAAGRDLRVTIDFPGGSAEVLEVDQQERLIRIRPAAHPDRGWDCWWYLQVSGITPGETFSLEVGDAPWATPERAAFSEDNETWTQTSPGKRDGKRIRYLQQTNTDSAWFAWGPPFTPEDAHRLVESIADRHEYAEAFELCRTRAGRSTPALRISQGESEHRYGIWIQARQHAWESGSSWVCRGLTEWLVSDDPRAKSLRNQGLIHIVPIMDIDNTAIGAGGKNQKPHDHNRDWSDDPHWRSTAAAMERIQAENEAGRFDLFVDLHNPDAGAKEPFYFITPRTLLSDLGRRNLDRFLAVSQQDITGPLAFRGRVRESGADYDPRWQFISKNWVSRHTREHVVAVTLETAWNTPHSTTDGYKTVGRQLGMAIERYLRTKPRADE